MTNKQWFEENDQYTIDDPLGERQWATTLALVRVYSEGATTSGWGQRMFATNNADGRFKPQPILDDFAALDAPFGIVMRSVPLVCVDIDGKNGGIPASRILSLPRTLAERSKSGNGYHLFYRVPDAVWDSKLGYAEFADANGLLPGIDIRATGIVYHYPQQRWNQKEIALVPEGLRRLLTQRKEEQVRAAERRANPLTGDDLLLARDAALTRLAEAIPAGKRNSTLFAAGCTLMQLNVKDWSLHLQSRGEQLGLEPEEIRHIVENVKRYAK